MTENLRHEAEVQRQHARIQLPASVTLAGQKFETQNWSNGGVALKIPAHTTLPKGITSGRTHKAIIGFDFEGFTFSLPLDIEIRHIAAKKEGTIGCRFTNLSRRQIAIIQLMVNSYIAGEIVQVGDLLDVAGRNNFTRPRTIPSATEGMTTSRKLYNTAQKSFRFSLVTAIFAALTAFILLSMYERMFVVKTAAAQVTADMISVDAPAGGKVYFKPIAPNTEIRKGELLLTISSDTGNITNAESPCDCIFKRRILQNNALARKGESALEMVAPDAATFVRASVKNEDAVRFSVGDDVSLTLPGAVRTRGTISAIHASPDLGAHSTVLITPAKAIPAMSVDNPVEVRIDTFRIF